MNSDNLKKKEKWLISHLLSDHFFSFHKEIKRVVHAVPRTLCQRSQLQRLRRVSKWQKTNIKKSNLLGN